MRKLLAAAAVLGALGVAPLASAHHSFAMFDRTRTATISGTVREFQWTNPHAYIQVTVREGNRDVEYSLEMGAPMYLYARGWRPRTLRPGMQVAVDYNPLRNGSPGGVVLDVRNAQGQPVGTNRE
ncbi:DUF6152 family protein [Alteraurantiacibacter buctensis]|uniref:Copper-binding protein n=1 Tax=Alteraurantiacibacter buctensis TaxID=1503981 RepID=A0A844YWF1_9SPHN|nr:DUF6152 family protein [Alteraurantiacibacter buctensis]MXO72665.1 hypothetical protein [Alteraurantiacibacter buctensis]